MDSAIIGSRNIRPIKPLVVLVDIGLTIVAPATATVTAQRSNDVKEPAPTSNQC